MAAWSRICTNAVNDRLAGFAHHAMALSVGPFEPDHHMMTTRQRLGALVNITVRPTRPVRPTSVPRNSHRQARHDRPGACVVNLLA